MEMLRVALPAGRGRRVRDIVGGRPPGEVSRRLRALLCVGVLSALGLLVPAASAVSAPASEFQQIPLAVGPDQMGEPMALAVLPDLSVVHTSRDGRVFLTDASGLTTEAGTIKVYSENEDGLQGVAADPNFTNNRWIYTYYSPKLNTPKGDAPADGKAEDFAAYKGHNQLSRFKLGTDGILDLASEQVILRVPVDRGICCHVGGDIDFDNQGNLLLTTGDNSNSFASGGFSPLDSRASRNPAFDAQRSAANSNDLRGKLLRIKVGADGKYSIPAGNMFDEADDKDGKTRPEIYAMGLRNPFRMSVDKKTNDVYLGEYAPDATASRSDRGPVGQQEFNRITEKGFYGWPYCTGTNTVAETYNRYDFATSKPGDKYDCQNGPTNDSPNNTGIQKLPKPKPSWLKYHDCSLPAFGCAGGESPMGGPVYRYPDDKSKSQWTYPEEYVGRVFLGEFERKLINTVTVNADGSAGTIESFPWGKHKVMDMAFSPDGVLYVLDYGNGWFNGDKDSKLYRIEHVGPNGPRPIAKAAATKTSGQVPLTIGFSSAGTEDPDDTALAYRWDFGDGGSSTSANPSHTYTRNGVYNAKVTVSDDSKNTGTASVRIVVGNTAPTITLNTPQDGRPFTFGDAVPWRVTVTDPEDQPIDCSRVTMRYMLGHGSHSHLEKTQNGCSGVIPSAVEEENPAESDIFGVFSVEYLDKGANSQPMLKGTASHITQPRVRQAEYHKTSRGVKVFDHSGAVGGRTVGNISNGDWIEVDPYTISSSTFYARVSSGLAGGTIEVRAGAPDGALMGSVAVAPTGSVDTFKTVSTVLNNQPAGPTKLYLVFKGGIGDLFDVDEFGFGVQREEAEGFTGQSGVQFAGHVPAHGGKTVGYIANGDWVSYSGIGTANATAFTARVSSRNAGGTIEVHAGGSTGPLLGKVDVPPTGGWENFRDVSAPIAGSQTKGLTLVFTGGTGDLFDVDDFTLTRASGPGQIIGHGAKCVDLNRSDITRDGIQIQLFTCNGTDAQRWSMPGDGTVRALGKCMGITPATPNPWVQTKTCDTNNAALSWLPQANGTLKHVQSGLCLDDTSWSTADRTPLIAYPCYTGANQKWTLP